MNQFRVLPVSSTKENSVSITSFVKKISVDDRDLFGGLFFEHATERVLGKKYELSLVFVGTKRAQKLNAKHRQKNYATDILSFSIAPDAGEIIICPDVAKQKSREFNRDFSNYIKFIFIHGLFHLKGFDHGSKMENAEEKIRKIFGI